MKQKYKINSALSCEVYVITNNRNRENKSEVDVYREPCDFETAVAATGFGKFNLLLALVAIPSSLGTMFDTSAMSYILPIAQCDLKLTLENKGMLNAITYLGMITSAFFWGYLADTVGRKRLMVIGYFLDGIFVLLGGFSQHYTMLVISKFMAGFIINGPYAALMSYLNEFHSAKYRPFVPLLNGLVNNMGSIILPLLGWLIFSDKLSFTFFNGVLVLRSWNIFIFVCSLPSIISGFAFLMLPESPKFLMTSGKNEKALEVFKKLYSVNTGKSRETYPVKALLDETKLQKEQPNVQEASSSKTNRNKAQAIKKGLKQMVPMFHPPYAGKIVLVFTIQFVIMMGMNTLRLWLPQLFTAINDYQALHNSIKDQDICKMVEMVKPVNTTIQDCFVNYNNNSVYTNNIIVGSAIICIYLFTAGIIRKVGKKNILLLAAALAGINGICLYFAKSELAVIAFSALYTGLTGITANVIVGIVVDIFPTTLRTMTVALTMMFGRIGSMAGNLIFPLLLTSGCLPPFLMISSMALGAALLSILLPRTDMKPLE